MQSAPDHGRLRRTAVCREAWGGRAESRWRATTPPATSSGGSRISTIIRYKAIVGSAMRARGLAAQRVEARIGCKILNTMTALGMPDSEMIG